MLSKKQYIQINQALFSLTHAYVARMSKDPKARDSGLKLSDCAVLMVLGQQQPISASYLSRRMDINPGTISLYVQRLVEKGLVIRRRDVKNRRIWWLTLSEAGEVAYSHIIQGTVEYTRAFLSNISPDEQNVLHGLLFKASRSLGFEWQ